MNFGTFSYPLPANEPVLQYAPNSTEKAALKATLKDLKKKAIDVPMYIGNKAVKTANKIPVIYATVIISDSSKKIIATTVTDTQGFFEIKNIKSGKNIIQVSNFIYTAG